MRALYCGVDLHSSNAVYAVADDQGHMLFRKRLANRLPAVLEALAPFREDLKVVAVEATYNWYWLVDGLMDHAYPVRLANPAAMKQYTGLKDANDDSDAGFLAELARLQHPANRVYLSPRGEACTRSLASAEPAGQASNVAGFELTEHGDAAGRAKSELA